MRYELLGLLSLSLLACDRDVYLEINVEDDDGACPCETCPPPEQGDCDLPEGCCGSADCDPEPEPDTPDPPGDDDVAPEAKMRILDDDQPSYFTVELTDAGPWSEVYPGWCVDADHGISEGLYYQVDLYSTYGDIPAGIVEKPQNFPQVNYLLNHHHHGDWITTAGQPQMVTIEDIQVAIWRLIDDDLGTGLEPNPAVVSYLVADTLTAGVGYIPGCGDLLALLAVPAENQDDDGENDIQSVVVETPMPPEACL